MFKPAQAGFFLDSPTGKIDRVAYIFNRNRDRHQIESDGTPRLLGAVGDLASQTTWVITICLELD
jgi:hypothetical protein